LQGVCHSQGAGRQARAHVSNLNWAELVGRQAARGARLHAPTRRLHPTQQADRRLDCIQESATNCIKAFLVKSASLELLKSDKCLLESNFISEVKNGLRSKSESARHEFVKVFVQFIRSFRHVFVRYWNVVIFFLLWFSSYYDFPCVFFSVILLASYFRLVAVY